MDAALANGIAEVLNYLLNFIQLIVIISILLSWVGDSNNPLVQMIYSISEPIYRPIRKFTHRLPGPFDWAPIVVIMIIIFLQSSVVSYLKSYARFGA